MNLSRTNHQSPNPTLEFQILYEPRRYLEVVRRNSQERVPATAALSGTPLAAAAASLTAATFPAAAVLLPAGRRPKQDAAQDGQPASRLARHLRLRRVAMEGVGGAMHSVGAIPPSSNSGGGASSGGVGVSGGVSGINFSSPCVDPRVVVLPPGLIYPYDWHEGRPDFGSSYSMAAWMAHRACSAWDNPHFDPDTCKQLVAYRNNSYTITYCEWQGRGLHGPGVGALCELQGKGRLGEGLGGDRETRLRASSWWRTDRVL